MPFLIRDCRYEVRKIETFHITRKVLGHSVDMVTTKLDSGLHVLVTGGCNTHVGAVTLGTKDRLQTVVMDHHCDEVVTEMLASALSDREECDVCVACGIHYDEATKEQIGIILSAVKNMVAELFALMESCKTIGARESFKG